MRRFIPHAVAATTLALPAVAAAAAFENPLGNASLQGLVNTLLTVLVRVGAVLCVLAIIFTGFKFVMAQGNPAEIAKAKTMFKNTIIGGIMVMGAFAISEIIKNTLCDVLPAVCDSAERGAPAPGYNE